jgi:hypothetical protein
MLGYKVASVSLETLVLEDTVFCPLTKKIFRNFFDFFRVKIQLNFLLLLLFWKFSSNFLYHKFEGKP